MGVPRRIMALLVVVAVGLPIASCTRKITRVEQIVQGPQACFECHSDTSTFLVAAVQQWEHSKHASGETLNENNGDCKGCHTSEGFVARATGVTLPDVVDNPTSIHCFTCHAPHTNSDFRLRWNAVAALQNGVSFDLKGGNICVACHHARRNVKTYITTKTTLSTRWGPHHGVQGDMLIGSNGYEYAGYTYSITDHRTATTSNITTKGGGCLECHKKTTSQNVVGGHSFNMAYMLGTTEILNTDACTDCHGPINDFSDVGPGYSVQDSVNVLITDLATRLTAAGLLDATGLPKAVTVSADTAGAVWNFLITKEDRSLGVHNAEYIMGLLRSSIAYIKGPFPQPTPLARMQPAVKSRSYRR